MSDGKVVRPNAGEPKLVTYLNRRGVALGLPIGGTFELTARCNFDCRMCYVHQKNVAELLPRELTADQWLSLASDARDRGMTFLLLTGGEPTLRSDFARIYTELIRMGILVSINTNGSTYGGELRELFRKYPPVRLNVTLYGGSEETYSELCGNASFGRVVSNLRSMRADGLQVRLNVTLTPYNVGDMEKIDEISRDIGLQAKTTAYMYPPVRVTGETGSNAARFDAAEAGRVFAKWNFLRDTREDFLRRADLMQKRLDAGVADNCVDELGEGVMCRAGRSAFWMTWDGVMLPCGTMPPYEDAPKPLEVGFDEAWNRTRAYTAAIRLPHECAVCPDRQNCSVCASICRCETGRFDGRSDYICALTKSRREETIRLAHTLIEEK